MSKTLFISDFDDTLAKTDARVFVTNKGKRRTLTPAEFATYQAKSDDVFDFSEFEQLKNPKPITRFVKLLKKAIKRADKVAILTARGHTRPVAQFLKMQGITSGVAIAALGNNDPQKKAQYIEKHIDAGFDRIAFVDDSPKNIEAAKKVRSKHPNIKFLVHQAKEEPKSSSTDRKEKIAKKQKQPQKQQTKREVIKQILRSTVTNPKTGEKIFVQTAYRNKDHPAHKQAVAMVNAYAKKHKIKN